MEITLIDKEIKDTQITVKEGETVSLFLISFSKCNNCSINVNVERNGIFNGVFADFSNSSFNLKLNVYLDGDHSICNWHSASLTKSNSRKVFDTSVYHNETSTKAVMSNYGICMDESKLTFTGISKINKGAKKTSTRQDAKIIVFDPKCDGKCSPILKIDENEVDASHAAVVGQVNENHLFYLQSRGINKEKAKISNIYLLNLFYFRAIKCYHFQLSFYIEEIFFIMQMEFIRKLPVPQDIKNQYPVTEKIHSEELSLPLNQSLTAEEIDYIIDSVNRY